MQNTVHINLFEQHAHPDALPQVVRIITNLGEIVRTTKTGATSTTDTILRPGAGLRLVFDKPAPANAHVQIWRYSHKKRERTYAYNYWHIPNIGDSMTRYNRLDRAYRPIGLIAPYQTGGFPVIQIPQDARHVDIPNIAALWRPIYMRGSVTAKYAAIGKGQYAGKVMLKFGIAVGNLGNPTRGHMSRDTLVIFEQWVRSHMGTPNEYEGLNRLVRIE